MVKVSFGRKARGSLFDIAGSEKLKLDALSSSEFTRGSRRYRFLLDENGKPKVSLKNGYLYLNDELKLTETKPDFFITADGDAVIFKDERLLVGNKLYSKKE